MQSVVEELLPRLSSFALILSFASYKGEVDLWPLNQHLLYKNQLCLPSLSKKLFYIHTLEGLHPKRPPHNSPSLEKTGHHKLLKPNPELYDEITLERINCILVPGLLFDKEGFRLGKGGGFYDDLLKRRAPKTLCLGLGFKEQFSSELLPREDHDQPVDELLLF